MSNLIHLAKALDEVALDLFKRDVEDRQRGELYSWNLRGNMLVDLANALRKVEDTEVFGETTQSVQPTVPWWYWVKLPLTRSFILEISKEDIERKYILVRLGDGGKEIVHFEKIKFSGPIQPPEGWDVK